MAGGPGRAPSRTPITLSASGWRVRPPLAAPLSWRMTRGARHSRSADHLQLSIALPHPLDPQQGSKSVQAFSLLAAVY